MKPVAAIATSLALLLAGSATAATAAGRTRIIVYTPFAVSGDLASGITIARSASGYCWTGSEAARRPDAWRCMVGNYIFDPCYSGARAGIVACPVDALGRRVLTVPLSKPLPRAQANPPLNTARSLPARVRLTTGKTCSFAEGATATLGGLRLNYACSNGGWLVGGPSRKTAVWTILYLSSSKASHAAPVGIATAWW
jgi:hypothetical protein